MIRINLLREGHGGKRGGGMRISTAALTAPGEGAPPWGGFATLMVLVVLGTLAWGAWLMMQNRSLAAKITQQKIELKTYEAPRKKVAKLEKEKKEYGDKVDQIRKLKDQQSVPVRLMNSLVEILPQGAWYDKVSQTGRGIHLSGKAKNIKSISTLYDNLVAAKAFSNVELGNVQQQGRGGKVYTYSLSMSYNPVTGKAAAAPGKG